MAHTGNGGTGRDLEHALRTCRRVMGLCREYKYSDAARLLDRTAAEQNGIPTSAKAALLHARGVVAFESWEFDSALEYLASAEALEPSSSCLKHVKGIALYTLGRTEDAVTAVEEAMNLVPNNPYVQMLHSELLLRTDTSNGAVRDAERALESRPEDPKLMQHMATIYACAGEYERALEQFAESDRRMTVWDYSPVRGFSLEKHRERKNARWEYKQVESRFVRVREAARRTDPQQDAPLSSFIYAAIAENGLHRLGGKEPVYRQVALDRGAPETAFMHPLMG